MSDQYVLLIREAGWDPETVTPDQFASTMALHRAFQEAVAAAGERIVAGEALQGPETAVKVASGPDGAVFTDGPFGETREVVTGFYSFTAENPQQAREFAALVPTSGWVELYPVLELPKG